MVPFLSPMGPIIHIRAWIFFEVSTVSFVKPFVSKRSAVDSVFFSACIHNSISHFCQASRTNFNIHQDYPTALDSPRIASVPRGC